MTEPCTGRLKSGTPTPAPPTVDLKYAEYVPPPVALGNPYPPVVWNNGDARYPTYSEGWLAILALLADGQAHTTAECIAAAAVLEERQAKTLLSYAEKVGRIRAAYGRQSEEVALDVFLVRNVVMGYRLADA
jgi:hypothetical protein